MNEQDWEVANPPFYLLIHHRYTKMSTKLIRTKNNKHNSNGYAKNLTTAKLMENKQKVLTQRLSKSHKSKFSKPRDSWIPKLFGYRVKSD